MYEVHTKSRKSSHETVQVTNYRFQKSMNPDWEIQPSLLYQAYAPASVTSLASVAGAALASSVDGHGLRFPLWHVTSSTAGHEGWWVPSSKTSSHQKSSLTRCPRWCRESIYCLIIQGFKEHMEIIWIYIYIHIWSFEPVDVPKGLLF